MANTKRNQFLLGKVEQTQSGKEDPYTVREGRFVGHDGFVVPKDFAEFYERFPRYVFGWVRKHLNTRMYAEAEDWTQELLLHLSSLPINSKYRRNGKCDVIQTFDPVKMHGANEARFRSYVNLCLSNKFNTLQVGRRTQPLCNPANFVVSGKSDDPQTVSDEYCHEASPQLRRAQRRQRIQREHEQWLQEFTEFADANSSGMASVVSVYRTTGTWGETANLLGLPSSEYSWARLRLKELGQMFLRR